MCLQEKFLYECDVDPAFGKGEEILFFVKPCLRDDVFHEI